jgi:hypothetical protein
MQNGHDPKAVWPFMAPMMAWSPQLWLGALFGNAQDGATKSVAATSSPLKTAETTMQNAAHLGCGLLKANAQAGAEMAALAGRRSQAYVALASDVGKCRAPQDLLSLQMQFWQTAMQHHADAGRRIAAAWSGVMPLLAGIAAQPANGAQITPPRDRITFQEPKDVASAAGVSQATGRGQGDRRSAA